MKMFFKRLFCFHVWWDMINPVTLEYKHSICGQCGKIKKRWK